MIEALGVESDDVGRAALVLGVARRAGPIANRLVPPVKAPPPVHVRRDVCVARTAQTALRALVERLVTLGALALEVRVLGDDVTGHNQRLDPRRLHAL